MDYFGATEIKKILVFLLREIPCTLYKIYVPISRLATASSSKIFFEPAVNMVKGLISITCGYGTKLK